MPSKVWFGNGDTAGHDTVSTIGDTTPRCAWELRRALFVISAVMMMAALPYPAAARVDRAPKHDAGFSLFPERSQDLSAETMPYTQMLHTGTESDTFYMRGRFGVDFPIVGYGFGGVYVPHNINFGITAATHINMIPTSSMKFPVDNFYATLALHLSGSYGGVISWRLYPIYHVSAHLADGNPEGIAEGVRPVSSEMVRGELYFKPFEDELELGVGAGWYYHVCAQKNLKYRADISLLYTPYTGMWWDEMIKPFVLIRAEDVRQDDHHLGIDISAGTFLIKEKRGMGISIRYFNKLHSSYYYEQYEKGWGVEYTFMF